MTAEEILFDIMTENNFTYVSFPSFVENESSVDVYDIACKAVEYAMEQYRNEGIREELIAFNKMMYRGQYDGIEPQIKACIDKYLKSKQ